MPDYGNRRDGSKKGSGYLGIITNSEGDVMTEYTVGVNIDGKEMDIPTITPNLTREDIQELKNIRDGEAPSQRIVDRAVDHAIFRLQSGRSVFADSADAPDVKTYRSNLGID